MLKLTAQEAANLNEVKDDLEAAGFKNIIFKLRPGFERVGSKQEPLFHQLWPRLKVSITLDIPAPPPDQEV